MKVNRYFQGNWEKNARVLVAFAQFSESSSGTSLLIVPVPIQHWEQWFVNSLALTCTKGGSSLGYDCKLFRLKIIVCFLRQIFCFVFLTGIGIQSRFIYTIRYLYYMYYIKLMQYRDHCLLPNSYTHMCCMSVCRISTINT